VCEAGKEGNLGKGREKERKKITDETMNTQQNYFNT
jgi:hypothetical protein